MVYNEHFRCAHWVVSCNVAPFIQVEMKFWSTPKCSCAHAETSCEMRMRMRWSNGSVNKVQTHSLLANRKIIIRMALHAQVFAAIYLNGRFSFIYGCGLKFAIERLGIIMPEAKHHEFQKDSKSLSEAPDFTQEFIETNIYYQMIVVPSNIKCNLVLVPLFEWTLAEVYKVYFMTKMVLLRLRFE